MPFRTTIFAGTIDVGSAGIKAIGVSWLLAALAFELAAIGVLIRWGWWQPLTYTAIAASILLTAAAWPEARLGLVANALIVSFILAGQRFNWL